MDEKYVYLILGIILGLTIAMYLYLNREEKIEKSIKNYKKNTVGMQKFHSKLKKKLPNGFLNV